GCGPRALRLRGAEDFRALAAEARELDAASTGRSKRDAQRQYFFITPMNESWGVAMELLNAMIRGVRDVDVPVRVRRHRSRAVELALTRSQTAPLAHERLLTAVHHEPLDAMVIAVGDVDVPTPTGCHTTWAFELALARAESAQRGCYGRRAAGCEFLDAMVVRVCDVDVSIRIERHTLRAVELAAARAEHPPWGADDPAKGERGCRGGRAGRRGRGSGRRLRGAGVLRVRRGDA